METMFAYYSCVWGPVIITQPKSWYSFQCTMVGRRL